jgi:KTSC domain
MSKVTPTAIRQCSLVPYHQKDTNMNKQSVISSNLRSVGYEAESQTLEVEFHNGGTYQYFGVPSSHYVGLMKAVSLGTYLHTYIKGSYRYQKLG